MEEPINETPAEILAYSRLKHKQWNKEGKASIVACSRINSGFSDPIKCEECNETCYYTPNESLDLKEENVKKICSHCILDKEEYRKHLNEEQIKILEMGRN
tara:strand:+ start:428 stop:730 length:303 start_codon:yes stop_codon:yes gene_type:complete